MAWDPGDSMFEMPPCQEHGVQKRRKQNVQHQGFPGGHPPEY
jgi:hypothetical protein